MWIIGNKVQFKVPMCETQRAKMALWKYPLSGFDESERRRIYTDAIYRCRLCCVKCLLWEDRLCSAWQAVHDRVMHLVVNVILILYWLWRWSWWQGVAQLNVRRDRLSTNTFLKKKSWKSLKYWGFRHREQDPLRMCKRQVLFPKKRHFIFLKCGKLFSWVCGILFSRIYGCSI